ncbi:hypothetical protein [Streptomyces erythrochromogenes]|uniref:hypothetical protein n=1 Tax=Streptomyces erythrochromogenes TaxID=285574 RepID=UPI003686EDC2
MGHASGGDSPGADGSRSPRQNTTLAALTGALIGALAGLAGSVLVFVQSEASRDAAAEARRADIRRSTYIDLGARTQTYTIELTTAVNMGADLSVSKDDLRKQCDDQLLPALGALHQARTSVHLVTSKPGREALAAMDSPVSELVDTGNQACARKYVNPSTFASGAIAARAKLLQTMQEFLDKVAAETI